MGMLNTIEFSITKFPSFDASPTDNITGKLSTTLTLDGLFRRIKDRYPSVQSLIPVSQTPYWIVRLWGDDQPDTYICQLEEPLGMDVFSLITHFTQHPDTKYIATSGICYLFVGNDRYPFYIPRLPETYMFLPDPTTITYAKPNHNAMGIGGEHSSWVARWPENDSVDFSQCDASGSEKNGAVLKVETVAGDRYWWLSFDTWPVVDTPNIDRLASVISQWRMKDIMAK